MVTASLNCRYNYASRVDRLGLFMHRYNKGMNRHSLGKPFTHRAEGLKTACLLKYRKNSPVGSGSPLLSLTAINSMHLSWFLPF